MKSISFFKNAQCKIIFESRSKVTNQSFAFSNLPGSKPRLLPRLLRGEHVRGRHDETSLGRSARCKMWIVTRAAGQTVKNGGEKLGGLEWEEAVGVPLIIPGPCVCSNVYYETGSINIVETALLAA